MGALQAHDQEIRMSEEELEAKAKSICRQQSLDAQEANLEAR
jgi:hypothetical protein